MDRDWYMNFFSGTHLRAPWPGGQVFGAKNGGRERNLSLGLGMVAAGCRRPDGLWEKNPFSPRM